MQSIFWEEIRNIESEIQNLAVLADSFEFDCKLFGTTIKNKIFHRRGFEKGHGNGDLQRQKRKTRSGQKAFLKMGAAESEIVFEKLDDVENVVVTKTGKTEETVIVGAHFDKTEAGCGAIDNWTGIVVLANLYRTMKDFPTEKTYKFVGFDQEEQGLLGSNAMAKKIPRQERAKYCAMVNFDSFGVSYPQVLRNISTDLLVNLAKEVSAEMKMPFKARVESASSDAESFRTRNIPSISFHGLDAEWHKYLHNSNDELINVNIQSVYFGYRHGLVFLSKIENMPCNAFLKTSKKQ